MKMNAYIIASYIASRYQKEYGERIDEMKLHKLLYFAQRESIIRTNKPMFEERFQGWRFGPVAPMMRDHYKNDTFIKDVADEDIGGCLPVMNYVFKEYAPRESYSLARLTRGEHCWKKSREGVAPHESIFREIPTEDIHVDAARVKERRAMLIEYGLMKDE